MSRNSRRHRRAEAAVRQAAHSCYLIVLLLSVGAMTATGRVTGPTNVESISVKATMSKPMKHQSAASPQSRAAGNELLSDAHRLQSQWKAESLPKAIEKYRAATLFFKKVGDNAGVARALLGEGEVLAILGEQNQAISRYQRVLSIASPLGDARLEVDTLNRLAEIEIDKRDRGCQAHAQHALEIAERSGYARGLAGALVNLGVIADIGNELAKALDYLNRALAVSTRESDPAGQAEALINLGLAYGNSGSVSRAQEAFDRALRFATAAGDRRKEARVHLGLTLVLTANAEWRKARELAQRTVALAREIGDKVTLGLVLNSLASVDLELGEANQSLANFNEARALWHSMGHRGREGYTLRRIAAAYAEAGREREALAVYSRLVRIARVLPDPKLEAYVLTDTGLIYESLGNLQKARGCYDRAIAIGKSLYHPRVQAFSLARLGDLYLRMNKPREARSAQEAALSLMRQAGDRGGEALVRYNIARLKQRDGEIEAALADIREIIQTAETQRAEFVSPDLRASYFGSVYRNYELLVDLLMQKHAREPAARYDAAALEESERGRARSLTEVLAEARTNLREGVPEEIIERERIVSIKLQRKAGDEMRLRGDRFVLTNTRPPVEKQAEKLAKNSEAIQAVRGEITALEAEIEQVTSEIEANRPKKYANLLRAPRVSLKQLQESLLDEDTLVLEYSLGEERSYLWVIGSDSFVSRVLPGRAEIERDAYAFYKALTAPSKAGSPGSSRSRTNLAAARDRLSRTLLGPVEGLSGFKRLVIIPDGALHYVPFEALIEPGRNQPLIIGHELARLPSLSVLVELRREIANRPSAHKTLAVFADPVVEEGDPRLSKEQNRSGSGARTTGESRGRSASGRARDPLNGSAGMDDAINLFRLLFARVEADALAALVPENSRLIATGFAANRQAATDDNLRQFRMVHFAAHGLLDFQHPKLSCLVLSRFDEEGRPQDGYLRLQDVYRMNLSADLVVLSACQTALGKEVRGEGLVGLTRGFFYAGASRVVASLWNVDDDASAKLMERFYKKMLGPEKLSPAAALRAAQTEMMREKRWEHAYYWAGFVLQGEWK